MKTDARETGVDLERFRLATFLEELRRSGELDVVTGPAELADVAPALEGSAKAVLFERVGGEGAQLAGNVMGSRARLARVTDFLLHTEAREHDAVEPLGER